MYFFNPKKIYLLHCTNPSHQEAIKRVEFPSSLLFCSPWSHRLPTMSISASPPAVRSFSLSRSPRCRGAAGARMILRSNTVSVSPILTKLQKDTATPLPVLRHVADAMAADMRAGLAADGASDLKMILSYVDNLPTGYVCMYIYSFWTYST